MRHIFNHILSLIFCALTPGIIIAVIMILSTLLEPTLGSLSRQIPVMLYVVTIVAAAHALILGLPFYLFIKHRYRFSYKVSALSGFIVGLLPVSIFTFPITISQISSSINGVPTMVNGVPTLAGWITYLQGILVYGLLGLVSAIVFKYSLSTLTSRNYNEDTNTTSPGGKK